MGFSSDEAGQLTAAAVGAALTGVKFLTAQAESALDAETSFGGLTNGKMIKAAIAAGVFTPQDAVTNTDYLAPGFDSLGTQTLGGNAQNITVPSLAGNTSEMIVIRGLGKINSGGSITFGVNNDATAPTYTRFDSSNGSNPPVGSTASAAGSITNAYVAFNIVIAAKIVGAAVRGGWWQIIDISTDTATREIYHGAFRWNNTTDEITDFLLKGSVANHWGTGFVVKAFKVPLST